MRRPTLFLPHSSPKNNPRLHRLPATFKLFRHLIMKKEMIIFCAFPCFKVIGQDHARATQSNLI